MSPLDPCASQHMKSVYGLMSLTLLAAASGTVLAPSVVIMSPLLLMLASLGCLGYIAMSSASKGNMVPRSAALLLFGALLGVSTAPALYAAAAIDPRVVTTAFLGTCTVFTAFSLSAVFNKSRNFLMLGGVIGSASSLLMILSLASILFQTEAMLTARLYLGLLLFCGYVLYDTQLILYRFKHGDHDVVSHSLSLFLDFVNMFVRLLVILSRHKKDDRKRN